MTFKLGWGMARSCHAPPVASRRFGTHFGDRSLRSPLRAPRLIAIFDQPIDEARRLLATGAPVYLFVNPVEYHGPHLSLHNDALVSRGLAADLHARLVRSRDWPFLGAADLEIGVDPCPGPGTRRTPLATARALVREACRALVELGARTVVLMTFHGSPLHSFAIEDGVDELRSLGAQGIAPLNAVLTEQLTVDGSAFAPAVAHLAASDREAVLAGLPHDFHAGFFETSLTLHYAPSSVSPRFRELAPCPEVTPDRALAAAATVARSLGRTQLAIELEFASVGAGWRALRPFPGYASRPHLANAESGRLFAATILDRYQRIVEDVLAGRAGSPPPIMQWLAAVSLGGRVGNLPIPSTQQVTRPLG